MKPTPLMPSITTGDYRAREPDNASEFRSPLRSRAQVSRPDRPTIAGMPGLRAGLPPDEPERTAMLDAEMMLAATAPPMLLQGDAVESLPDAIARVSSDALPVVTTTWALSQFPIVGQSAQPAEAIGRCWSRGRVLAWLADS
jgi:Uncharacterized protein conserved in bacteria (DUF2332)